MENTGKKQLLKFVETRLHQTTCPITNTICKNNFKFFRTLASRCSSKKQEKLTIAKDNVALFSQVYISCRTREGDLKNFFLHKNQTSLPSLSENGHLRTAKSKPSIIKCIEQGNKIHQQECLQVDSKIFDGGALVNVLRPANCRTFDDYSEKVVMTYIKNQLHPLKKVDIVWDQYFPDSLKKKMRNDCGTGVCRKVKPNGYLPIKLKIKLNYLSFFQRN